MIVFGNGFRVGLVKVAVALLVTASVAGWAREEEEMVVSTEVEGRKVVVPPDLNMALDWYAPRIAVENGLVVKGWVKKDIILLLTDKNMLVCINRADGTEKWRADLTDAPRYEPAVSRSNIIVNIKNYLVAIHKRTGRIRWRMLPKFVMSTSPMVIDPAAYPKLYTNKWQDMESMYVPTWNGRFHAMTVQGRVSKLMTVRRRYDNLATPEFTFHYAWHHTHETRGVVTAPLGHHEGTLYYIADDGKVYGVTRDDESIEPYMMQDKPCTELTVDATNCYVGCRDFSVYALDRLTLRKKWTHPLGTLPKGRIFSDEPGLISYVYAATVEHDIVAIKVHRIQKLKMYAVPEHAEEAWTLHGYQGAIGASEKVIYLGDEEVKGFRGFKKVAAVDKETGKVLWKSASKGVAFYLEFQNAWRSPDQPLRLYTVTKDNRLLSFKERKYDAGPLEDKPIAADAGDAKGAAGAKKVPGAAQVQPE